MTVLVNAFADGPVEIKRRGVDIREAFNQIDRYQRDSFWAGSGLFEYVQLFVISNGTLTKVLQQHGARRSPRRAARQARTQTHVQQLRVYFLVGGRRGIGPSRIWSISRKTFFAKHDTEYFDEVLCVRR